MSIPDFKLATFTYSMANTHNCNYLYSLLYTIQYNNPKVPKLHYVGSHKLCELIDE